MQNGTFLTTLPVILIVDLRRGWLRSAIVGLAHPLRFALFGAGFWARYQLSAWQELGGVECVAIYNRTLSRAEALAREFGADRAYGDAEALLAAEDLDFVDIATDVSTHAPFVKMAAERGIPVICQKPMGITLAECEEMVSACREAGVPLLIHENWRWQAPIRAVKDLLRKRPIGEIARARISMVTGFDVFENQPFLRETEQFILADLGSHLLDTARFLFGEPCSLYCRTQRIRRDIRGEDVATVLLSFREGPVVICEMSYAGSRREGDCFPQTMISVEGSEGTLDLGPGYEIRVVNGKGARCVRAEPPLYSWADPQYQVVHSSIVPIVANLRDALLGKTCAETTGDDNLRTMRLVFAAYESAARNQVLPV